MIISLEKQTTRKVIREIINLLYEDSIYNWNSIVSEEFKDYVCEETGLQKKQFNLIMAEE